MHPDGICRDGEFVCPAIEVVEPGLDVGKLRSAMTSNVLSCRHRDSLFVIVPP